MSHPDTRDLIESELPGRFSVQRVYPGGGEGCSAAVRDRDRPGPLMLLKILDAGSELREASLLASFRHAGIPELLETGVTRSGRQFLLREHLAGQPISTTDRLPTATLRRLAQCMLETLAYVHLRGVLHMDIKPANVLARPATGDWALLDFGLGSRSLEVVRGGTPYFVAPEVLWGLPADPRSDLFSLGAMLVLLSADSPPVSMANVVRRFPNVDFWTAAGIAPSDLPSPFDRLLPRLVARELGGRFVDAQEALEELIGRTGRPSVHLLRPDPILCFGDQLPGEAAVGDRDLIVSGGDGEDRRGLAAHAAARYGGVVATEALADGLRLRRPATEPRGRESAVTIAIPDLTQELIGEHFERVLDLPLAIAHSIAAGVIEAGVSSGGELFAWLASRTRAGRIVPDGPRWSWPEALAGRVDAALREVAPSPAPLAPDGVRVAAAAGAFEEAEGAYRRALGDGIASDLEREYRAALAQGLLDGGAPARALPLCHDQPPLALRARLELGNLEEARALLATYRDRLEPAAAAYFDACLAYRDGEFDTANEAVARLAEHRSTEAEILSGMIAVSVGRHDVAVAGLRAVLERVDGNRQPFVLLSAHTALARALRAGGDLDGVEAQHEAALAVARRLGHVRYTAAVSSNLGVLAKDRAEYVVATGHLRRARAMYEHLGDREGLLTSRANLALIRLDAGDADGARRLLDEVAAAMRAAKLAVPPLVMAASALASAQSGRDSEARSKLADIGRPENARAREMVTRVEAELGSNDRTSADPPAGGREQQPMDPVRDSDSRALLRSFLAVNRRLASGEISDALAFLLDTAVTLTGGRHGYLLLRRGDDLRLELTSGGPREEIKTFSRSIVNRSLQLGVAITGRDAAADRELADMPSVRELHRGSALCVPFSSPSDVEGAVFVAHPGRTGAFGDQEKECLEAFADQAAIAVDRMLHEERLAEDLERSRRELRVVKRSLGRRAPPKMIGQSAPMKALVADIAKLAQSELSVLIRGETGVGKELVARALHDQSPRRGQAFVSENCSAIPAELMESELFGHCRGAFTGADEDRPGLLEVASGGTVFLDEVGDMPASLQAKLLRALQEQQIRRVGGTESIAVDVRVLSATHKDLEGMFATGAFREDLYYRLAAVELSVPPLRERDADLDALADEFLRRLNDQHGRSVILADDARGKLRQYDWPGNVRELEHVVARAFLLCERDRIVGDQVPGGLDVRRADPQSAPEDWPAVTLAEAEARTIRAVLRATGGEKTLAAKRLGISRTALYQKLRRLEAQGL